MNKSAFLAASVAAASVSAVFLSSSSTKLSLQVLAFNREISLFSSWFCVKPRDLAIFLRKFSFLCWNWNARFGYAGRRGAERPHPVIDCGECGVDGEVRAAVRWVAVHRNADYCAQMNVRCGNALLGFPFSLFDLVLSRKSRKTKLMGSVWISLFKVVSLFWLRKWERNCNTTELLLLFVVMLSTEFFSALISEGNMEKRTINWLINLFFFYIFSYYCLLSGILLCIYFFKFNLCVLLQLLLFFDLVKRCRRRIRLSLWRWNGLEWEGATCSIFGASYD